MEQPILRDVQLVAVNSRVPALKGPDLPSVVSNRMPLLVLTIEIERIVPYRVRIVPIANARGDWHYRYPNLGIVFL